MKRPRSVWLLIVLFTLSLARGIAVLFQQSESPEAELYAGAGIEVIFYLLVVAAVLLDAIALRYLWAPRPQGLRVGLASVGVGLVLALMTAVVAAAQPEVFASVITAHEEAAGRSIDPDALEFMTSGRGLSIAVAASFFKAVFLGWLLWWNRGYFFGSTGIVSASSPTM
jgi:hypothetical protein